MNMRIPCPKLLNVALAASVCSCSASSELDYDEVQVDPGVEAWEAPTWEAFRAASSYTTPSGEDFFAVESDLPVRDEEELRQIYDALVSERDPKAIVKTMGANGSGGDDAWLANEEQDLTYCVASAGWPAGGGETAAQRRTLMLQYMADAGRAWQNVANIRFRYVPGQDASCAAGNTGVRINVIPWVGTGSDTGLAACAYWPRSGISCGGTQRSIGFNYALNGATAVARTAMMMHEIGHILGLHHEQLASNDTDANGIVDSDNADANCVYSSSFRRLYGTTTLDTSSIMGYSSCNMAPGNTLSARDGLGMRELYGAPVSWYAGYASIPLL
jgi:hypothetical protein